MRMFIPAVGETVTLTEPWNFEVGDEYRNSLFCAKLVETGATSYGREKWHNMYRAHLPAGSKLKIDRIYIKKGSPEYNSVTFIVVDSEDKQFVSKKNGGTYRGSARFWVKLAQANRMMIEEPAEAGNN